jgi:hypothetical protein
MARLLRIVTIVLLLLAPISGAHAQTLFQNEQAAQQHCPDDTVVWLNLPTGVYHFKGQRWYGNTNRGDAA